MRAAWILTPLVLLALAGCGTLGKTPEPLPTVVLQAGGGTTPAPAESGRTGVTASGVVVPAKEAHLAFALGGNIQSVNVEPGDPVTAGQVLVEVDSTRLHLQVEMARRVVRELTSPASVAAAGQALAVAQKAADDAQKKVYGLSYPRASETLIHNIEAQIELTREDVARKANDFRSVEDLEKDDPRRAEALAAMTEAQMHLNQLIANYNWYTGKPSDIDAALATSNLAAAQAALQEAEWYLTAVKGEPVPDGATGSLLAQLQNARDDLAAAEAAYEASRLTAPFTGTVSALEATIGDYVPPGFIVATVADLAHLRVETTDLSELDVSAVSVGQGCTVSIKALGASVPARVLSVSPLPTTLGGDVVYATTIGLDSIPEGLRPGMTAVVAFQGTP
jgi:multidrug efflux pump subunit AcrA (membrane-fusion protein)